MYASQSIGFQNQNFASGLESKGRKSMHVEGRRDLKLLREKKDLTPTRERQSSYSFCYGDCGERRKLDRPKEDSMVWKYKRNPIQTLGHDSTIFPTERVMAKNQYHGSLVESKATKWKKLGDKTAAELVAVGKLDENRVSPKARLDAMVLRIERLDLDAEEGLKEIIRLMKSRPEDTWPQ